MCFTFICLNSVLGVVSGLVCGFVFCCCHLIIDSYVDLVLMLVYLFY